MGLRERRTFRIPSHRYSRTLFVSGFRLFWVILIIWGELGTFFWSLSSCRWPVLDTVSWACSFQLFNPLKNISNLVGRPTYTCAPNIRSTNTTSISVSGSNHLARVSASINIRLVSEKELACYHASQPSSRHISRRHAFQR